MTETWLGTTLVSAIRSDGTNLTSQLVGNDDLCAVVSPSDTVTLKFTALSPPGAGTGRDFVLVTTGYFYPALQGIGVFQNVTVSAVLSGSSDAGIIASVVEDILGYGSRFLNTTHGNVSASPPDFVFSGYANRSYELHLAYLAGSPSSKNVLTVTLTFSGQTRTFAMYFNGTDGLVQVKVADLNGHLSSTLYADGTTIWMKNAISFEFEPLDLIPDRHILGWLNTYWVFGDGTSGLTTSRIAAKAYSATGARTVSATVTYEDEIQASTQQAIQAF